MTGEIAFSRHVALPAQDGWDLLTVSVDEGGVPYALMSDSLDGRGHAPTRYRAFRLDPMEPIFETAPMRARLSSARPLGNDLLLTGGWPFGGLESGCVFSADGAVRRTMDLGLGIADIQVSGDAIWVSYFDEGVFSKREEPGLAQFDWSGARSFSYREIAITGPESLVPDIADCYALNVVAPADVWLYYYTEFPLVHLRGRRVEGCWMPTPVRGARAVAVREPYVVFLGSYTSSDTAVRYDLRTRAVTRLRSVTGSNEEVKGRLSARGAHAYVVEHNALWIAQI